MGGEPQHTTMNSSETLASRDENAPKFPARPFQIVSLLDMVEFNGQSFYLFLTWIESFSSDVRAYIGGVDERATHRLTDEKNQDLRDRLDGVRGFLEGLNKSEKEQSQERLRFQRTTERIQIFAEISPTNRPASYGEIGDQLQEVRRALKMDLEDNKFLSLSFLEVGYFGQEQGFGPEVFSNFQSTRIDVAEANNCYALGRYTACVFHCMRVLEKGLHALAYELDTKHNAQLNFGKPFNEKSWGLIIADILISLESPKRTKRLNPVPTKDQVRFYSTAAVQFEHFQHAWRDDCAHANRTYDEPAARSVLNHTHHFMGILAKNGLTDEPFRLNSISN
jgi:hypothetical protein